MAVVWVVSLTIIGLQLAIRMYWESTALASLYRY